MILVIFKQYSRVLVIILGKRLAEVLLQVLTLQQG
jgi:hypothetical protein